MEHTTLYRTRDELRRSRLRDAGDLIRVRPGVYAASDEWRRLQPWERYEVRVRAHAAVAPHSVFCHESAAVLLGLPVFGEPRDIHLYDAGRSASKRTGDLVIHTSADSRVVISLGPYLTTSFVDTAVDLGRVLPPAFGLATWDAVLARGWTLEELSATWRRQTSSRGSRTLAWLTAAGNASAESALESISRAVVSWLGFPAPELQTEISIEGHRDRVDMYWRSERIAGEADGYGKYAMEDNELGALKAEKIREDRLRRRLNGFARWDFAQVMRAAPFRDVLRAAGLREVTPPDHAMLATLRPHPRRSRSY